MNIITVSREFGSGGRELGKRLSDRLGYDYYDSEIISAIARESGMDAGYADALLNNYAWKNQAMSFRSTLGSSAYIQSSKVALLLQQKKVIEHIASLERDCIIVGRNADVLLRDHRPFNIFVCADTEAKLRRCRSRAPEGENLSDKELFRQMKQIDKVRSQTRDILTGSAWGQRDAYHLTVNTSEWEIKELVEPVAEFALRWFGRAK